MQDQTSGVLKKHTIRQAEPHCLGPPSHAGSSHAQAAARVVRQQGAITIVQITCGCGEEILLECQCDNQSE